MLEAGGFLGLPAVPAPPDLLYVHASGGRKPLNAGPMRPPRGNPRSVADVIAEHRIKLERLVARDGPGYRLRVRARTQSSPASPANTTTSPASRNGRW